MILMFQTNPLAPEATLEEAHMKSLFACVLSEWAHHDVRTISAMLLERIASEHARSDEVFAGGLPRDSLVALATRMEEQLASAKQYGLQSGMVSLLVKAAAFHQPSNDALRELQHKFGQLEPMGTPSRPEQPSPRRLLANFNQQTAHSHVYSFVPHRLVVGGEELRRDQLDFIDWNWDDVRLPARYPGEQPIEVVLSVEHIASLEQVGDQDGTGLIWLVLHLQPEKLCELQVASATGPPRGAIWMLLESEQLRTVHDRFIRRLPKTLQLGGVAPRVVPQEPACRPPLVPETPLKSSATAAPIRVQASMSSTRPGAGTPGKGSAAAAGTPGRVGAAAGTPGRAGASGGSRSTTPRLCITGAVPTAAAAAGAPRVSSTLALR